jgi:hypothetical protein
MAGRSLKDHYATDCERPITANLYTRVRDLEQRLDGAIAAEREACAVVVETWDDGTEWDDANWLWQREIDRIAAAIRARGDDEQTD